jgi:hypothetical protein
MPLDGRKTGTAPAQCPTPGSSHLRAFSDLSACQIIAGGPLLSKRLNRQQFGRCRHSRKVRLYYENILIDPRSDESEARR